MFNNNDIMANADKIRQEIRDLKLNNAEYRENTYVATGSKSRVIGRIMNIYELLAKIIGKKGDFDVKRTYSAARVVQIKERDVYITDDIIVILQEHIKSLPEGTKILFPSQVNGYLSDTNLRRRVWQPLLAYVGITDRIRLHDLRGSYADIALEHGASIKFIQNQLGHAKAQTTLDIYMKNNDDTIKNALEQMNGVFTND